MIEKSTGDILNAQVEALVNTVNCVGIMGRGIALRFKNRFPENFKAYARACKNELVQPGTMFVFETRTLQLPKYIINFPTKRHWRGKSRMEDISSGLKDLAKVIQKYKITSIAVPPLGSGLGGLDWNAVRPLIEKLLSGLDIRVLVYEPAGAPENDKMAHSLDVPIMSPGRAALVGLMQRYLVGLLSSSVSLLEIHKLMYFLQESGENINLNYTKGTYGPYAQNLRHVLTKIEGYFISGYADGGDRPDKHLELVPGAAEEAGNYLQQHQQTRDRFDKVAALVDGFESSFGLELLATVHWIVTKEKAQTREEIVRQTYAWNEHKKQFSHRQINLAVDVLAGKCWIALPTS